MQRQKIYELAIFFALSRKLLLNLGILLNGYDLSANDLTGMSGATADKMYFLHDLPNTHTAMERKSKHSVCLLRTPSPYRHISHQQ